MSEGPRITPGDLIEFHHRTVFGIFTCPFSSTMPHPVVIHGAMVGRSTRADDSIMMAVLASVFDEQRPHNGAPRMELFVKVMGASRWVGSRFGWIPRDHIPPDVRKIAYDCSDLLLVHPLRPI